MRLLTKGWITWYIIEPTFSTTCGQIDGMILVTFINLSKLDFLLLQIKCNTALTKELIWNGVETLTISSTKAATNAASEANVPPQWLGWEMIPGDRNIDFDVKQSAVDSRARSYTCKHQQLRLKPATFISQMLVIVFILFELISSSRMQHEFRSDRRHRQLVWKYYIDLLLFFYKEIMNCYIFLGI